MELKNSTINDIDRIMDIIKQAQIYFKNNNINQWQDNYPNFEVIKRDIENDESYILEDKNIIVGTAAISFSKEKNYNKIYEGNWKNNFDYAVIHRIAIDSNYKRNGYAEFIFNKTKEFCLNKNIHSIRIDTHRNNIPMQNLLNKNNFIYCGIIFIDEINERLAFEKII